MTDQTLTGKVALVTGGSRGIGAAIAKRLAADGAAVAITYAKGREPAEAVVKGITDAGGRALAIQADAADADAVVRSVEETVAQLGRLDVLVNNVGIASPGTAADLPLADFDRMFAINVRGLFVATQAALKHLTDGGRVINIGSNAGDRAGFPGISSYAATKGAVRMFTQGVAREVAERGITVNTVAPGPTDTDMNPSDGQYSQMLTAMIPLKRYGTPEEVAAAVAFIASPAASFVNGATLLVDGGLNA